MLKKTTVNKIKSNAFADCNTLQTVTFVSATPITIGTDVFGENDVSIIVPVAAINTYRSEWTAYSDLIVDPPETGIILDIILPSVVIGLTLLATVVVWKKKEQF